MEETGDEPSYEGMKVVLCLGNRYMRDDGVGPEIARRLRKMPLGKRVVVRDSVAIDLGVLWQFRSARKLLVVDAVRSGDSPGTVSRYMLVPGRGSPSPLPSLHGLELADAVDLVSSGSVLLEAVVVGVEPKDSAAGEGLSAEVEAAIPRAIKAVLAELRAGDGRSPSGDSKTPKAN